MRCTPEKGPQEPRALLYWSTRNKRKCTKWGRCPPPSPLPFTTQHLLFLFQRQQLNLPLQPLQSSCSRPSAAVREGVERLHVFPACGLIACFSRRRCPCLLADDSVQSGLRSAELQQVQSTEVSCLPEVLHGWQWFLRGASITARRPSSDPLPFSLVGVFRLGVAREVQLSRVGCR